MSELAVTVERTEVLRGLGYGRRGRPASGVAARLDALWPAALALLRPRGSWRVVGRAEAAAAGMPRPAGTVAVALCTIGAELEAEAARRAGADRALDALILDAIGSAAAEAAADALNAQLCAEAGRRRLYAAPRVSPGYGRWTVASQPALLALLPAARLGVALTPGLMMVPRKSVSFAVNFLKSAPRGRAAAGRCARCGRRGCPYAKDAG